MMGNVNINQTTVITAQRMNNFTLSLILLSVLPHSALGAVVEPLTGKAVVVAS